MADLHEAQPGAEAPPETTLAELIARSGDLKSELVDFVQHARFDRQLTTLLRDAAGTGPLDEAVLVRTIDHFALEYRLRDGGTVVEQFVALRRPPLTDDERAMLLGWRDVVEGYFEVHPAADDDLGTVVLHNLVDDLYYPRRLAQRHPDGVDLVFRTLLRRPRFCWHRDGEDLLRTRKKEFFQRETAPSFTVTGRRLAELLYPHGNEDGIVIPGC